MWHRRPIARVLTPASAAVALLALMLVVGAPPGVASDATSPAKLPHAAVPVSVRVMPVTYDPVGPYEAQAQCSPAPKPGTLALARLIRTTYGQGQSIGISRGCSVGGTSEHKEGRALDWMTSVRTPQGRANAQAFLTWLLGPDAAGVVSGNATRLGVMYVGWNNRFWATYDTARGWTELKGCFAKPDPGSDTTCHRNHVHLSMTWDGASGRTSFWDGTSLPPFCVAGRTVATVAPGGRAASATAVVPFLALDTRAGQGIVASEDWGHVPGGGSPWGDGGGWGTRSAPSAVPAPVAPCRLGRAGGWGDSGGLLTSVTGQGGVPDVGVVAVEVVVMAIDSTAPAVIAAGGPGQVPRPILAVGMNGNGRASVVVPVAADGTISLTTSAGGADLRVAVTGYFLAGDQPNVTAIDTTT